MNVMKKRLLALASAGAMTLALLAGCTPKSRPTPTPEVPTPTPTAATTQTPDSRETVKIGVINGPTGMGAAQLMALSELGETRNSYEFTIFTDNQQVTAALTNGEVDVAAMASNVAANLYHKTDGGIQMAAVTGLGVLKILQAGLEPGEATISSLAELKGQTIYAMGQGANPEYVLNYLLTESGLNPESDVDIQFMTPEEVTQGLLSGKTKFAMLPVPAANAVAAKSMAPSHSGRMVHPALDLNDVWNETTSEGKLTMSALVVRSQFAKEHPETVRVMLEEYGASIDYMTDPENLTLSTDLNPAKLLEKYELVPAVVAQQALEQANLTFITGGDNMRDAIQGYYEVLYAANPASIGGGIPDDGFYFE